MDKKADKELVKIPILTDEELMQLGKIMYSKDKLSEIKFWEEIYKKRGLKYKKKGGQSNAN